MKKEYYRRTLFLFSQLNNCIDRKYFAYVPQGNSILSGTIRDNLCLGGTEYTDEQLRGALSAAEIWDYVKNLPGGLDTLVGERGIGLSEGQAQRIAIARGLLRQPRILLMDEATSALDEPIEEKILRNVRGYLKESTIIMITHRSHAAVCCDEKIVL